MSNMFKPPFHFVYRYAFVNFVRFSRPNLFETARFYFVLTFFSGTEDEFAINKMKNKQFHTVGTTELPGM